MSGEQQMHQKEDADVQLALIAGSGDTPNNNTCSQVIVSTGQRAAVCCKDQNHRKLAICSIICGISCIGIISLINSVKAEETTNAQETAEYSQKAKKFGIMSILTWVALLALAPMLMALISYLLTLQD